MDFPVPGPIGCRSGKSLAVAKEEQKQELLNKDGGLLQNAWSRIEMAMWGRKYIDVQSGLKLPSCDPDLCSRIVSPGEHRLPCHIDKLKATDEMDFLSYMLRAKFSTNDGKRVGLLVGLVGV